MEDIDFVMSPNSVSRAEKSQDFPSVVANPDTCSYFTELCSFLVNVDLYIRQFGESNCSSETSWPGSNNGNTESFGWWRG